MATLLYKIGGFAAKRHFLVIGAWLVILVSALVGAKVFAGQLDQSIEIPGTQSQIAIDLLQDRFPQASGASAKIIFVAPAGQSITNYQTQISAVATGVAALDHVAAVTSPFASGAASQISAGNNMAYLSVQYDVAQTALTQVDEDAVQAAGNTAASAGLTVAYSGITPPPAASDYSQETIGLGVAFLILALTFGSLLAAGMPLITAALGVGVSTSAITILASFVTISSTAPVLSSMLGLAVGIDYALFIVSRHRSQLARGIEPRASIALAVSTAGSAVVFAGLTVIIALIGLSVAQIPFLSVMGLGAAFGVLLAVGVSTTLLPAILGLCGKRLIPRATSRAAQRELSLGDSSTTSRTIGRRWVGLVTKRPLVTVVTMIVGLLIVAVPALGLRLTIPDAGYDPPGSQARVAYDLLAEGFGPGFNGPLLITADLSTTLSIQDALTALQKQFTGLDDVANISQAVPNQALDMAIISITPSSSPDSDATQQLVQRLRSMAPAFEKANGFSYLVTGQTAVAIDISDRLFAALGPFAVVVVGLCIVLLTVVFRSLAVPLTATMGFLLSVGAAFGVVTAVFNWGWLAGPIGVEKVGPVISFMPILVMAVLFGLAMDYQVFLVSRMREEFIATGQATLSVRGGFSASARVVTAASLIMFSVFASFVPGGGAVLQPLATALAVGVVIDAFVVRMTLIPAVMTMLGNHAWYLPRWLERVIPDIDLEGNKVHGLLAAQSWRPCLPDPEMNSESSESESESVVLPEPVIAAGDLAVAQTLPFDVVVAPGDCVIITGTSPHDLVAVLATFTGRFIPASGRLTVLDLPQPYEASRLRREAVLVLSSAVAGQPELTVASYLSQQVALDARVGERHEGLSAVARYLRRLEKVRDSEPEVSTRVTELSPIARWRLDVALALGSGRKLIAIDVQEFEHPVVLDLITTALAAAPFDVTLVFAAGSESVDPSTDRILHRLELQPLPVHSGTKNLVVAELDRKALV